MSALTMTSIITSSTGLMIRFSPEVMPMNMLMRVSATVSVTSMSTNIYETMRKVRE